jgi:integrase
MAKNLIRKGNALYCRVTIPRPLRQYFLNEAGKPRDAIWETLGPDLTVAKPKCAARVAHWENVFARMRAGESLDDIRAADERERVLAEAVAHQDWRKLIHTVPPDELMATIGTYREAQESYIRRIHELEEHLERRGMAPAPAIASAVPMPVEPSTSETVSQAAEALYGALERDGRRQTTVDGHRLRVRAFIEACGDIPLSTITRRIASDFLDKIGENLSNRTRNAYAMTMALVIETARKRGRFQGENPFEGQKAKAVGESYQPFEPAELQRLFAALPREVKPAEHSPETALPWVALIAAYTGMRLEEIAQLSATDVHEQQANGATITVIDIHNGGNNALKNKASARLVPVHSELVRAGFLDYVQALPQGGMLFPGLIRRASKGGKIGARLGELFRKKLVALGIKRDGICFHSFRHTVAGKLEQASVSQTDAARVLGHAIAGMSYGVYSSGPGLKRLAGIIEEIRYDGLKEYHSKV